MATTKKHSSNKHRSHHVYRFVNTGKWYQRIPLSISLKDVWEGILKNARSFFRNELPKGYIIITGNGFTSIGQTWPNRLSYLMFRKKDYSKTRREVTIFFKHFHPSKQKSHLAFVHIFGSNDFEKVYLIDPKYVLQKRFIKAIIGFLENSTIKYFDTIPEEKIS